MTTPKKGDAKAKSPSKPRPHKAVQPNDDPIAAFSASAPIDYDFTFDVDALNADIDAAPSPKLAAEILAADVMGQMQDESASRIAKIDASAIAAIIQAILAIAGACPKKKVVQALTVSRDRPKSLAARSVRMALARRLPGPWLKDAMEASRAMIAAGVENQETEVFSALFPEPANAGAPEPLQAPALPGRDSPEEIQP